VTALDFLSLDGIDPESPFRPLARSPFERRLRDAGAELEERGGWLVATRVPGEEKHALAVRDLTHLHRVSEGEDGIVVQFAPGDAREPVTVGLLWNGAERPPENAIDVSAGYAALGIAGPGAATVLRRLTELDLTDLPKVGAIAHVRACVVEDGADSFRLVFEQEYGHYLWEVVVDAAEPLGGGPVGTP
jgi:heterotetrameric sarcosine oxidase gamma subunit